MVNNNEDAVRQLQQVKVFLQNTACSANVPPTVITANLSLISENHSDDLADWELPADHKPYVILVVGVNGVGRTGAAVPLRRP